MSNIAIFYGSTRGTTEDMSWYIASQFGLKGVNVDVYNVAMTPTSYFSAYDRIIFGASTWKGSVFQDDWEFLFMKLKKVNLESKKIAIFGTGNQRRFPMTFVDAMGHIHDKVTDAGAKVVGRWSTDGYLFAESKALIENQFVGLAIDEHNQSHKTQKRIKKWVDSIAGELVA